MTKSMTGFARQEQQKPWGSLSCEIRSVNHRYLEPNIRLPESLRNIEPNIRETLRNKLGRGKIEVSLSIKTESAEGLGQDFNEDSAKAIVHMAERINSLMFAPAPINGLDVLAWPGVLQTKELDHNVVEDLAKRLFDTTLQQLIDNRSREGEELAKFIEQRLDTLTEETLKIRKNLPKLQQQQQEKIQARMDTLNLDIDEERLAQELVYLAQKSDIAEELDRLHAHLIEIRRTLTLKEPVGRRLDFLMQELNREANTLSSKSTASSTTQTAVELKVLIEQMREQIQNIE